MIKDDMSGSPGLDSTLTSAAHRQDRASFILLGMTSQSLLLTHDLLKEPTVLNPCLLCFGSSVSSVSDLKLLERRKDLFNPLHTEHSAATLPKPDECSSVPPPPLLLLILQRQADPPTRVEFKLYLELHSISLEFLSQSQELLLPSALLNSRDIFRVQITKCLGLKLIMLI